MNTLLNCGVQRLALAAGVYLVFLAPIAAAEGIEVYFQAHRGGINEVPENTLAAMRHAWSIPGAVPEIDLRTTQDGVIVGMHDETPDRTVATPDAWKGKRIREIPYAGVKQWDAGASFSVQFKGEPVPTLEAVLTVMKESPERQIYLDLKDVDTNAVCAMMERFGVISRVIFVHGDIPTCRELQRKYPGVRTMTWFSGSPEKIMEDYNTLKTEGFAGVSQLQFHLRPAKKGRHIAYVLPWAFLKESVENTARHGVALQVRPFIFDSASLQMLYSLGIHWYVTDEPRAFYAALAEARLIFAPRDPATPTAN
ncbi:MAG: glycerophosphodiester phosphodiesterase family protein [Candidatus Hydrogenedentes bacterium]|nr:glycerophosphodiester phosphodiesterase family protein [Candidatus Hydrogenedentota bacterium]